MFREIYRRIRYSPSQRRDIAERKIYREFLSTKHYINSLYTSPNLTKEQHDAIGLVIFLIEQDENDRLRELQYACFCGSK